MTDNTIHSGILNVPPDFTIPSSTYKKHIVYASAAIFLFIVLYFGLAFWFIYKAYILFADTFSGGRNSVLSFIVAVLMSFLGLFMVKAIFFINRRNKDNDIEIKKEDEPELFEFIYNIADKAKAPRPHKVFLSNTVNACVFYDISLLNLIFPSRKNLDIGLGLVNALNLGEFKSVLAHEFGHFTQRSMLVGRWVYIAHQVVYQIVTKRDGFDRFLNGFSRIDLRVAWIGWILSIIVWSIRSLVEIFFKLVVLTQRALSREMEFHADLVAVSLTGSDALINSLYKLSAADETFENAIGFLNDQLKNNKKITDIYALQANSMTQFRIVLNNPEYGVSPMQSTEQGQKLTVFKEQIAQIPKMWNTHPSNLERERNAKKIYIHAAIDERSAWILFKNADKTKEKLTSELFREIKLKTTPLSRDESLEIQTKEFKRSFLLPKYRGIYLDRPALLSIYYVKDIYDTPVVLQNLPEKFAALYPPEMQDQLQHIKNLNEELFMLQGLDKNVLTTNEGRIIFRGKEINKDELSVVIESTKKELETENDKVDQHLKYCRNLHYQVAKKINEGWDKYLVSITMLVHYCEHRQKHLEDQSKFFFETLNVLTASRVSESNLYYLLEIANDLHGILKGIYNYVPTIKLNAQLISKLNGKEFSDLLQPLELNPASRENINSWVRVVGSWINLALDSLRTMRLAALDELLVTEEYIEKASCAENITIDKAPVPVEIIDTYAKYNSKLELEVQKPTDFYSRFMKAEGIFPSIAKYTAAALIIIIAVFFATSISTSKIVIYNGFPQDVIVYIDNHERKVDKGTASEITIDIVPELNLKATTVNGETIESFKQKLDDYSKTYVYNIAGSAVIYTWVAYYGYNYPENEYNVLGAQRWMEIDADDYFEEPPSTVQLKPGQTETRLVVAEVKTNPLQLINMIKSEEERNNLLRIHALWEETTSPDLLTWLNYAAVLKDINDILKKRLQSNPLEIPSLRLCQDLAQANEKKKVCEEQNKLFLNNPQNPNLYYLNCRCFENEEKMEAGFLEGNKKWPDNPWLAYAAAYTYTQYDKWEEALSRFDTVCKYEPGLKGFTINEMKRICNLLGKEFPVDDKDIAFAYLSYVNSIENSTKENTENKLYAYKILNEGRLIDALNFCSEDSTLHRNIMLLAAVSEGASKSFIEESLALSKDKEINSSTIIPVIALASMKNEPLIEFNEAMKSNFGPVADSIYKFIDFIKHNKLADADKLLKSGNVEQKGKMCLLGVLLLRKNAPEKWKRYADKLLFITEKPYLNLKIK